MTKAAAIDANAPADIRELQDQLLAAQREAEELVTGLSEELGNERPDAGGWSVAECLDISRPPTVCT